jgi:hypothetical protein
MNFFKRLLYRPFFIKLLHWEYWSFNTVYGPIYIFWVLLCIRTRSFFFFSAANPSIRNGGFLLESKMDIYNIMPRAYYPPTIFFKAGINSNELFWHLQKLKLTYPVIGKPDIGGRGKGVKKLYSAEEVVEYAINSKVDFLLQDFVEYEFEVGIFYYRYPKEEKGRISGIVGKEFLTVEGDGITTTADLLKKDKRFILQLPVLNATMGNELKRVLPKGERKVLVPYGNHARGAKFIDASHLIDDTLTETIDAICRQIPHFYFGRMDIRYNNWDEMKQGRCFSIIEVNGAGSEPTHIYDPAHTIFFAWKEIIRHWIILNKISRQNHKLQKLPYMRFKDGMQMFKENAAYEKIFKQVN